jgi:hypothetical protein
LQDDKRRALQVNPSGCARSEAHVRTRREFNPFPASTGNNSTGKDGTAGAGSSAAGGSDTQVGNKWH